MKSTRNLVGVNVLALLALCGVTGSRRAAGSAQLPVPCVGGTCGPAAPGFVSSGQATAVQAGNTLTVNQSTDKTTLNWQSFNISADGKVQFVQPAATSVALNRIYQQTPSSIFGQLTANGQIYLVNPNGILFGATSKVNTAGLIASSLGISDDVFNQGLLAPALLAANKPALSASYNASNPVQSDGTTLPGAVIVQQGATISTPSGRILLAAPTVQNAGTLSAPDGQVVLAAGQDVYLQASTDSSLRGLIVEVDHGGMAWNQLNGELGAPRGNISMVGLAVNQDGRISATTTVAANGSVRLEAADTHAVAAPATPSDPYTISATKGGTLTIGAQSSIDIDIDSSSTDTAAYNPNQLQSTLSFTGKQVFFEGGSIKAPNANLKVFATSNPTANPAGGAAQDGDPDAQIRIHSGTSIDLSGSTAELPVDANLLAIQLRANELADDPTQRNGALRGQTVYVDTRVGTSIVGPLALQAAEQAVARNEAFWSTKGGTASFQSEGDIVAEQGTSINVSGGKTIYDGGSMQTTQLLGANGRLYDIGSASQLMTYTGVVNPTFTQNYDKWGVQSIVTTPGLGHYESGYVDGASAGSIQFAASGMALGGTLLGQAVNGTRQRSGSNVASGGTLILGLPKGLPVVNEGDPLDYLAPPVIVVENPAAVSIADGTPLGSQPLRLGASGLTTGGFTNIQVYSNSSFTVAEGTPLTLNPGTSLLVDAPRIDIGSSITSASGNIQLQSVLSAVTPVPNVGYPGIQVESGVTLDVRGQWTNDSALQGTTQPASGPTLQDGGKITLDASQVDTKLPDGDNAQIVLGDNVSLRASGGGWVSTSNVLTGGKGGNISITSAGVGSALQIGNGVELDAFGVNGAMGGQFSLRAPRIEASEGTGSGNWADAQRIDELTQPGKFFDVHSSLFSDYGFSSVSLMATAGVAQNAQNPDVLTVDSNTIILAQQQTLLLNPGYLSRATGTSLDAFSHEALLPAYLRSPASVLLSVVPQSPDNLSFLYAGRLDVQAGAQIITDPGVSGKILLTGVGGVYVDGKLSAPGGTITLNTPTPPSSPDPGYVPNLAIELGPDSVLDTSGTFIQKPSAQGLLLGTVLDGGTVNLFADRGMVMTDPGSFVDVQGASATLDIPIALGSPTYKRQSEGSAGGSVTVHSPEAISLRGTFKAAAGSGSYGDPAGGSLEVELTRADASWFKAPAGSTSAPYPDLPFGLVIDLVSSTQSLPTGAPDGLSILGQDQIVASGFDALYLVAGNTLRFSSSEPLSLTRQIILDAPTFQVDSGVQAAVAANYVQIADSQQLTLDTTAVQAGTGSFSATAQQIDLLGAVAFSGTQKVSLTSTGDLLLRGVLIGTADPLGSLVANGELDINAGRVYPATQTAYSIEALGDQSIVKFGSGNQSPGVPLSAAGSITVTADNIDSAGTLLAPFGMINLVANNDLTLESTSITSVSAAGATIPYGLTQLGGINWVYNSSGGNFDPVTGIPTRQVSLSAANLVQKQGAKIDLSGGGDLYAYEFVPGTGGSTDALAGNSTSYPGLYAVLPSMLGQFAPYDPQESAVSSLQPGASIYLSGIAGLPAGYYPLLPARDALLPGAFLVKVETGYSNIVPGQQSSLTDGTPMIAGYLSFGTTGQRDGGYQGVAVWPGSYGRTLATYQDSYASAFFAAAAAAADKPRPSLPVDAGRLSLSVDANLTLQGTVLTGAGSSSGLGAVVDISATNLEVISDQGTPADGAVGVLASTVSSWHAGTLLLGGHVTSADGLSIAVNSDTVTVDAGAQLQAGQVILVANQQIDLKPTSTVMSTSAGSGGKAPAALPLEADITLSNASGAGAALLAVSDLELPVAQRAPGSATLAGINIETGATVASHGAIAIDAPGTVSIGDGALNASGAALSLASSSIALGAGTGGESMQLTQSVIGEMQSAGAIRLSSLGAIDLNTAVQLGSRSASGTPSTASLTLSAQSLNNTGAGDGSTFTAGKITLGGPTDFASASPSAGSGSLNFDSNEFELGAGTLAVSGFASTHVTATSEFSAQQQKAPGGAASGLAPTGGVALTGGLVTAGDLSITAPVFTAGTGALGQISALNGTLSLVGSGGTASTSATGLGGALEFGADAISVSGLILAPSGKVTLQATHDINFASTAGVDVSGRTVTIGNQTVGSEGGNVLMSAGGNLTLASGSSINVSAAGDTPAGQILLTAVGNADIGSQLQGKASSGAAGGIFNLDAGSLSQSLDTLSSTLQGAGFSSEVDLRVHTGDLVLSSAGQITSNKVSLTADTGTVDIAGTISAPSADLSGTIGLFGGQGVSLEGRLIADTQGTARGIGGTIELGTGANGSVTLANGSLIEAPGSTADGTLRIRAPLVNGGTDIAVNWAGSNLSHLSGVYVEPVLTEAASLTGGTGPTPDDYTRIQSDVSSMMAGSSSNISNRLNPSGATSFHIRPAVDVVQNGDLTLDVAPDLSTWQFNGQPVDLAFRATGNLTVNANITDGFQPIPGKSGAANIALLPGYASADLRFVGGADIGSANPLATVAGAAADVKIAGNTTVATGTGEIDLVASRDIVFLDTGAKVYTAGTAGADYQLTSGIRVLNFPTGGGNVLVDAGRDIQGVAVPQNQRTSVDGLSPSTWQTRILTSATSAEWGVDFGQYATYGWNVGSLGGGDVSVSARGDMANLSVAVADSYLANANGPSTHFASGGLDVRAVGDIGAGDFYVANGSSLVSAGGSFNSGESVGGKGSLIAMGDAQVSVEARLGASIDGVINPTLYVQSGVTGKAVRFFSYGPESALTVQTSAGDIDFGNNLPQLLGQNAVQGAGAEIYPGNLIARSLSEDLTLTGGVLFPSANGQLQLLAGRNIIGNSTGLRMSDAPAASVATAQNPGVSIGNVANILDQGDIHSSDPNPAVVVAGQDVSALVLNVPKPAEIIAGRDITDLSLQTQNLNSSDLTLISAGRDYLDDNSAPSVSVGGPGRVALLAGRNVDLGISGGIVTTGNLVNANLPTANGADITVMAGLGQSPDLAGFLQKIVVPSSSDQALLVSYVENQSGRSGLSFTDAESLFSAYSVDRQRDLLNQIFFHELEVSGQADNTVPGAGFTEGYAAIDAMFPNSRTAVASGPSPYSGDLSLAFSRIYTLSGGDISLLVPGGLLNVGLANPPASLLGSLSKHPSDLGIVAEGPGNINIYTKNDVDVNASRIFTLGGGNIMIWSDEGNIDAGRGSKSSLSAPPPTVLVDSAGNITLSFTGAVAGSGIRTIQVNPSVSPGNVELIAPIGTVNAGDAGIGASGNIVIAAAHVLGLDNIQFGGTATGVPAQVSDIGVSLAAASSVSSGATNTASSSAADEARKAATAAPITQAAISWLEVFLTGLGEENCRTDDLDCLKRQPKH